MIVMLIEIGELAHDAIFSSTTLFAGAYVFGKLLALITAVIMNDTDDYL